MRSNVRQKIAEEAARIMLDQGETDYHNAKQKAAAKSSVSDKDDLPSNQEIEDQIKLRQTLFDPGAQKELIRLKRLEAQKAMTFFQDFNPLLAGPVMEGTASKYSPIEIHLFVDAVEEVTIFLMEHDVPFQIIDRRLRMGKNEELTVPVLSFYAHDQLVEVSVFQPKYRSHSPLSPVDGAPQRRINRDKLQKLLDKSKSEQR